MPPGREGGIRCGGGRVASLRQPCADHRRAQHRGLTGPRDVEAGFGIAAQAAPVEIGRRQHRPAVIEDRHLGMDADDRRVGRRVAAPAVAGNGRDGRDWQQPVPEARPQDPKAAAPGEFTEPRI